MNWTKLLYVAIIILLYIPMTFLGANVFFPKYTGSNTYYREYSDCYMKYPAPIQGLDKLNESQLKAYNDNQRKCNEENQAAQIKWEEEKNAYEGNKYVMMTMFNLLILLFALFVPRLLDSVIMGLFLGSITSTFSATIRYFDTNSKIGFISVVITFFVMIFFINKKKDTFVDWKTKERKGTK
jgi:uncharacterized membrane protein